MAEWFKAAVLKTVVRKYRGFESYSLRHFLTVDRLDALTINLCIDNQENRYLIDLERWPSWLKAHAC